jgi:hypothetical protein
VSSFLDTIAVLVVFAPWLVGATGNKALEHSRWRGVAICTTVIIALMAMFAFQACVCKTNDWGNDLQLIVASIDTVSLFPGMVYTVIIPLMAEEDEE